MSQDELQGQTSGTSPDDIADIQYIFTQLPPLDVEQFYAAYQIWSKQQQITLLQKQLAELNTAIAENARQLQATQLSPIALVALEQLQTRNVTDIDILDRIIEQGDPWLDHTMHLLLRCERLDLIGGDYTQWCEHALDGAYEWLDSMNEDEKENGITARSAADENAEADEDITLATGTYYQVTEDQLLQKLMSDDGETPDVAEVTTSTLLAALETAPGTNSSRATEEPVYTETAPDTGKADPIDQPAANSDANPIEPDNVTTEMETQPTTQEEVTEIPLSSRITQPLPLISEVSDHQTNQWPYVYPKVDIDNATNEIETDDTTAEATNEVMTDEATAEAISEIETDDATNGIETDDATNGIETDETTAEATNEVMTDETTVDVTNESKTDEAAANTANEIEINEAAVNATDETIVNTTPEEMHDQPQTDQQPQTNEQADPTSQENAMEKPHSDQKQGFTRRLLAKILGR
jgi:hypothetical protein